MQSSSSSTSSSHNGTPTVRSRSASGTERSTKNLPPTPRVLAPAEASGCWRLCCPPQDGEDDQDIELANVVTHSEDCFSQDSTPERIRAAQPGWRTLRNFDPSVHLTLDASGLHPNYRRIGGGSSADTHEDETAGLLNHAMAFAQAAPTFPPRYFHAATHVQPDGTPNIPGILNDPALINDKAQQIEVYRWARIYQPNTRTDPKCLKVGCVSLATVFGIGALVAGLVLLVRHLSAGDSTDHCDFRRMNSTQVDDFLQVVRHDFPGLSNATLADLDDWFPQVWPHVSPATRRDAHGNLIQEVCTSAAQALEPVFLAVMLFGALALAG